MNNKARIVEVKLCIELQEVHLHKYLKSDPSRNLNKYGSQIKKHLIQIEDFFIDKILLEEFI